MEAMLWDALCVGEGGGQLVKAELRQFSPVGKKRPGSWGERRHFIKIIY